jgi:hypothetical protein
MHPQHAVFLEAIAAKRRLSVRYFDRKLDREVVRVCAPLDFGPLRGPSDGADRYQFWDLESKKRPFNVAVVASEIAEMTLLAAFFDPAAFITWAFKPNAWHIKRDWGPFS